MCFDVHWLLTVVLQVLFDQSAETNKSTKSDLQKLQKKNKQKKQFG